MQARALASDRTLPFACALCSCTCAGSPDLHTYTTDTTTRTRTSCSHAHTRASHMYPHSQPFERSYPSYSNTRPRDVRARIRVATHDVCVWEMNHMRVRVCIRVRVCVGVGVCVRMNTNVRAQTHTCKCTRSSTRTGKRACIRARQRSCTHVHVQVRPRMSVSWCVCSGVSARA